MKACPGTAFGKPGNRLRYLPVFRQQVHELLLMGYQRLDHTGLAASEEPEITGELVRAMHEAMQNPRAPEWTVNYALPKDDPPLDVPGHLGKRRPRVDIEFERVQCGPRPRYRFEAKRLDSSHSASMYLGEEGLGCFLSNRYPVSHGEAGMLGYVQSESEVVWASRIESRLAANKRQYAVRPHGAWQKEPVIAGLDYTYRTSHDRMPPLKPVTIRHVLLRFC